MAEPPPAQAAMAEPTPAQASTAEPLPAQAAMAEPAPDVVAAARDPRLVPLWAELARRMGASARPVRRVRLTGLDADEREAVAGLLRSPRLPAADVTVSTERVAAAYGLDDVGLRRLVEAVRGPVGDRASTRAAAEAARRAAADRLAAVAARAGGDTARLVGWARAQAAAVDGDLAGHVALVERVLAVIAVADPVRPTPLPLAAARSLQDPHALDVDQRAGRLLTAALAARAGVDELTGAARRRDLLRGAGLLDDQLSSTVLVWGLPLVAEHPVAGWTDALADAGEASSFTLAQLRRWPLRTPRATTVRVVENPSVLAAAARAGCAAPLLCTAGVPSVAALTACEQLVACGCRLDVHADFDPTGLRIVAGLLDRFPRAAPWRMTAGDYRAARASAVSFPPADVPPTPWDPPLAAALRDRGRTVFEEQLVETLLR